MTENRAREAVNLRCSVRPAVCPSPLYNLLCPPHTALPRATNNLLRQKRRQIQLLLGPLPDRLSSVPLLILPSIKSCLHHHRYNLRLQHNRSRKFQPPRRPLQARLSRILWGVTSFAGPVAPDSWSWSKSQMMRTCPQDPTLLPITSPQCCRKSPASPARQAQPTKSLLEVKNCSTDLYLLDPLVSTKAPLSHLLRPMSWRQRSPQEAHAVAWPLTLQLHLRIRSADNQSPPYLLR